jgi:hypothetical protein
MGEGMTAAAIKATFTDYRRIKSRKVMQIVFEVPLETWPRDYKVLGEPEIETSQWFAIARMTGAAEPAPAPKDHQSNLAANAALMMQEPIFTLFMRDMVPDHRSDNVDNLLKRYLGISSKSELNTDAAAAARWRDLRAEYEAWKRT